MARTKKFHDITGMRFGRYTAIEHRGNQRWLCRCDCGVEKEVLNTNLFRGTVTRCEECRRRDNASKLVGARFGKWTVLKFSRYARTKKTVNQLWLCRCDCGAEKEVQGGNLRSGASKGCSNCYVRVGAKNPNHRHGHSPNGQPSPTYVSWASMIQRCTNPEDAAHKQYGGAGIRVCQGWREFTNFVDLMGERPSTRHSLDRANDSPATRHYSCGRCAECQENGWIFHCRWATQSEQSINRSSTRYLELDGRRMTMTEWSKEIGVSIGTISLRLKNGWSVERTLTTPKRKCRDARVHTGPPTKHGHCPKKGVSPTYRVWMSMIARCFYSGQASFKHYGAKGIRMCRGWRSSFETFLTDMGERPSFNHSIDRANKDSKTKHYSCGHCTECVKNGWTFHCRWATKSEQMRNTRKARLLTFRGVTKNIKDWSEELGIPESTLTHRLNTFGWSVERALSTPRRQY